MNTNKHTITELIGAKLKENREKNPRQSWGFTQEHIQKFKVSDDSYRVPIPGSDGRYMWFYDE